MTFIQGTTEKSSTRQNSQLFTLERSSNAERPRHEIRQDQIHRLSEELGFRWVDIARMLGMSPRTLSRRRQEFGMPLGQQIIFPPGPTPGQYCEKHSLSYSTVNSA